MRRAPRRRRRARRRSATEQEVPQVSGAATRPSARPSPPSRGGFRHAHAVNTKTPEQRERLNGARAGRGRRAGGLVEGVLEAGDDQKKRFRPGLLEGDVAQQRGRGAQCLEGLVAAGRAAIRRRAVGRRRPRTHLSPFHRRAAPRASPHAAPRGRRGRAARASPPGKHCHRRPLNLQSRTGRGGRSRSRVRSCRLRARKRHIEAPPPLERFFGGDARAGSEMGAESRTGSSGMSGSWLKLMPSKAAGPGRLAAQLFGEAGMAFQQVLCARSAAAPVDLGAELILNSATATGLAKFCP